jgi:hypothetical protein
METEFELPEKRKLLLEEIKGIIQWRMPQSDHAQAAYHAVQSAFVRLASEQFRRYPSSGLHWNGHTTQFNLDMFCSRFFGFVPDNRNEFQEFQEALRDLVLGADKPAEEEATEIETKRLEEQSDRDLGAEE